jgi:hypothetical protein
VKTAFHSHLGWIHSKSGSIYGSYRAAVSSLSKNLCPGYHPSYCVPCTGISRQEEVKTTITTFPRYLLSQAKMVRIMERRAKPKKLQIGLASVRLLIPSLFASAANQQIVHGAITKDAIAISPISVLVSGIDLKSSPGDAVRVALEPQQSVVLL